MKNTKINQNQGGKGMNNEFQTLVNCQELSLSQAHEAAERSEWTFRRAIYFLNRSASELKRYLSDHPGESLLHQKAEKLIKGW